MPDLPAAAVAAGRRRGAERAAAGGAGQAGRRTPGRELVAAVLAVAAMDVKGPEAGLRGLKQSEVSIQASGLQLRRSVWQPTQQRRQGEIARVAIALGTEGGRRMQGDLASVARSAEDVASIPQSPMPAAAMLYNFVALSRQRKEAVASLRKQQPYPPPTRVLAAQAHSPAMLPAAVLDLKLQKCQAPVCASRTPSFLCSPGGKVARCAIPQGCVPLQGADLELTLDSRLQHGQLCKPSLVHLFAEQKAEPWHRGGGRGNRAPSRAQKGHTVVLPQNQCFCAWHYGCSEARPCQGHRCSALHSSASDLAGLNRGGMLLRHAWFAVISGRHGRDQPVIPTSRQQSLQPAGEGIAVRGSSFALRPKPHALAAALFARSPDLQLLHTGYKQQGVS